MVGYETWRVFIGPPGIVILTGHAHDHATTIIITYVKSFDHDEAVMKSRIPNMNSTNRIASTRNK